MPLLRTLLANPFSVWEALGPQRFFAWRSLGRQARGVDPKISSDSEVLRGKENNNWTKQCWERFLFLATIGLLWRFINYIFTIVDKILEACVSFFAFFGRKKLLGSRLYAHSYRSDKWKTCQIDLLGTSTPVGWCYGKIGCFKGTFARGSKSSFKHLQGLREQHRRSSKKTTWQHANRQTWQIQLDTTGPYMKKPIYN